MTSPLISNPGQQLPTASTKPQHLLGEFPTYTGAEQLVDKLSDAGFPVEHTRIVGNGLRTVEYVTGRLTNARAALAGVASGAWFGLLVGLLLGLFTNGNAWYGVLLTGLFVGAAWGALFGFLAHASTRGRHDYASVQRFEAEQYQVYVDADRADEAIRLSGRL